MSEFRNKIGDFYLNHQKGFKITKDISLIVSASAMALMLGIIVAASIITGGII